MCLTNVKRVDIASKQAWKVFVLDRDRLTSAFYGSRVRNLFYEADKKTECCGLNGFYAFEKFEDAMFMVEESGLWNFCGWHLIVLPVVLHDLMYEGDILACHRTKFTGVCYTARFITVLDSEENRLNFYKDFVKRGRPLFRTPLYKHAQKLLEDA